MKVIDFKKLVELLPDTINDFEVEFLCPDGYVDNIEDAFNILIEDKILQFLSYCHR